MKLIIDISKERYDEIMAMDWKNCRRFFDEEIRAIHDGKALEQEPCTDAISREEAIKPFLVDATEEWISADIVKYLKSLLSVMPTMRYPQVPGITPIVVPVEEEQGDIQYDNKTTLNKG